MSVQSKAAQKNLTKDIGCAKRIGAALFAAVALAGLTGCDTVGDYFNFRNSLMNPAEVGRFDKANPYGEARPVTQPILSQLDVSEDVNNKWTGAVDPTPADLVVEAKEYVISTGDAVGISIFELLVPGQEYTKQLRVNELGDLSIQNVGNIHVGGLTPTQVEQKIAQTLVDQKILPAQPGPQVSVTLLESRAKVFSILGAVGHPGTFNIVSNEFRLLDAIALAGDTPVTPGMDYVYVIRQGTSAPVTPTVPVKTGTEVAPGSSKSGLDDLDSLQHESKNPETAPASEPTSKPTTGPGANGPQATKTITAVSVSSGSEPMSLAQADLNSALVETAPAKATSAPASAPKADTAALDKALEVSTTQASYVDGKWVALPSTKPATSTAPTTAVATTSGPATTEPDAVESGTPTRVIKIPMGALREGVSKYNIVVRPGDVINIPQVDPGEFYLLGNINRPGVYSLTGRKITTIQALAAGGNLGGLAIPRRCELVRRIGDDKQITIQVNLQKITEGEQPDFYLKANDVLNIGTDMIAPFLAVTRNAYRATYGWGFTYDRNFNTSNNNSNGG